MKASSPDISTTAAPQPQAKPRLLTRVWRLYYEGFRDMTSLGRSLWVLIILKVVILFFIFKLIFFPDLLKRDYDNDNDRAEAVRSSLLDDRRR